MGIARIRWQASQAHANPTLQLYSCPLICLKYGPFIGRALPPRGALATIVIAPSCSPIHVYVAALAAHDTVGRLPRPIPRFGPPYNGAMVTQILATKLFILSPRPKAV